MYRVRGIIKSMLNLKTALEIIHSDKVLLIVDVQNDFCPGGSLAVSNGDQVVAPINKLIKHFLDNRWVAFASRDWHPLDTGHFATNGGAWPIHCVANTDGAKFHKDLNLDGVGIISKGMDRNKDAYSAFDGFCEGYSPIVGVNRPRYVKEIYVCGLATDYCVQATTLSSIKHGYKTYVVIDACRAVNMKPNDEIDAINEMKEAGAIITTTEEIIR